MRSLKQEFTIFGDFDQSTSFIDIESYANSLSKYDLKDIERILKGHMQDILSHLLGAQNYFDAIMLDLQQYGYMLSNRAIGKKKLSEFLSLLIAFDRLGIHVDELTFSLNKEDYILEEEKDKETSSKKICLKYLSFENLDDFLEQVIYILENNPSFISQWFGEIPGFVTLDDIIPDPESINLRDFYYESINDKKYIGDETENNLPIGKTVEAEKWIRAYQHRYSLRALGEKNDSAQDKFDHIFKKSDSYSEKEIERLKQVLNEKEQEIRQLKEELEKLRKKINDILKSQGVSLTPDEFDQFETEYILKQMAKAANVQSKKTSTLKGAIYAVCLAGLLAAMNPIQLSLDIPQEPVLEETPTIEEPDLEETVPEIDEQINFKIGGTIPSNVPYYDSSTSKLPLGFTQKEGIVIGYFATTEENDQMLLISSCKTQEEVDHISQMYENDPTIHWRAAICSLESEELNDMIASGERVPYTYTTCYVDYEPVKEYEEHRRRY